MARWCARPPGLCVHARMCACAVTCVLCVCVLCVCVCVCVCAVCCVLCVCVRERSCTCVTVCTQRQLRRLTVQSKALLLRMHLHTTCHNHNGANCQTPLLKMRSSLTPFDSTSSFATCTARRKMLQRRETCCNMCKACLPAPFVTALRTNRSTAGQRQRLSDSHLALSDDPTWARSHLGRSHLGPFQLSPEAHPHFRPDLTALFPTSADS
jgi:hypothetical protein